MALSVVPLTLAQANDLVARWHRHHKPVRGHRFSIGVVDQYGVWHGAAIIGRPTGRKNPQYTWAEVTRLVTDGTKNACSCLYSAAARAAKGMGFERIQTFILEDEPGTSLKAAGWEFECWSEGGDWNVPSRGGRRVDQPQGRKQRWKKELNHAPVLARACVAALRHPVDGVPLGG
jgi:hypothetical protein